MEEQKPCLKKKQNQTDKSLISNNKDFLTLKLSLLSLQVQCLATLQVGSVQASDPSECGQCLSLAWMPTRPHHHLAAGYYNGKNKQRPVALQALHMLGFEWCLLCMA
jgi:hypothetical protein